MYILLTITIKLINNFTFETDIICFTAPYISIKLKFIKLNCLQQPHYITKKSVLLPRLTEIPLKKLEINF